MFGGSDLLRLSEAQMMAYRRRIQIIFQNPYASLNPRFTVGQILTEPMKIHRIGASDGERFERAAALARRVGLAADSITSTRTNSPAASGSGSPSRAACRCSPRC